jgi:hypothetical protein
MALLATSLTNATCDGRGTGNGAADGSGEAIDASTDSSVAQAIEAAAPTGDSAMDDASALDAAAPTVEPAPALDASPVPLDAFGGWQTFSAMSCGSQDAQSGQLPSACPCNGAVAACILPDAGTASCTSTDLQGQTCETLGFARGTLGCDASCTFDTSGCDTCVTGPHTACASLHVADGVAATTRSDRWGHALIDVTFALAASDTEIGLAWEDGNGTLHFTRLGADLTQLSDQCLASPGFDASTDLPPVEIPALSLASTSTGWLFGAYRFAEGVCPGDYPHGTFLHALDRAGRVFGPPEVVCGTPAGAFEQVDLQGGPTLSSLPGGRRSLLTWLEHNFYWTSTRLQLQVVEADGRPVTGPDSGTVPESGSAYDRGLPADSYSSVAIDDGFAVETPNTLYDVAFDGTFRSNSLALSMSNTDDKLAWSGSELRLLGMGFLQRISAAGALIGNPAPIAAGPGYALDHDTLLAIGPDSVVHVTQNANSHYSEELVRFDSSGTPVLPPVPVVHANYGVNLQTVAQGGDAVVAWIAPANLRPTRIELARVRLTP